MKDLSKTEKIINFKKNNESFSSSNHDSFYSSEFIPQHYKIMNRKRTRFSKKILFHKLNDIRKKQSNTNKKLDIILSIIKSKILGEYDYNIAHYDFYIQSSINDNKEQEIKNKEDNDFNIKDEFDHIETIKKNPYSSSTNVYKKRVKKINNNSLNTSSNLKQIINDFLYQNKNGKNIDKEDNNNLLINNGNENIGNNNNNEHIETTDINNLILTKDNNDIKEKNKSDNPILIKNIKTFSEINDINLLKNNFNNSLKNDLDLNKYKFETKNINSNGNIIDNNNNNNNNLINDNNILNNNLNDINNKIEINNQNKIEENNNNKDKKEKKPSHPLSSIGAKAELFKKMMQVRGGGILGHHSLEKKNSTKNPENNIKIEPTKNEGNTVEILSNLKVTKVAKKKPKKINFDD